ncbi:CheY-like receiver and HD-GYP domain-containing response regulator [Desulfocapsa sulfexigens DSM 10523]|uniref:CheY-like receiver and HD-GYP domain-containing response regulator n=1 Tax=Desulfocapsa sulfexigens (strain DSM 10523 / SB164P1) TaxID=1167006 RepID=M1PKF2_DESSD|nr:HD domain-containing phosphohydrolase [Desulfocapsa sulfexigens]AGF79975.1 CheY-like receiver and HD-GYP domain-containing response regulator [Desulfocapsa sulfexigens DSM 10523]
MNRQKSTILLVDDIPANIKILVGALRDNYRLVVATSGFDAIAAAIEKKPDLILLDVMMPGMDGYEVCKRLKSKRETADIPIIFVTAMNEERDETRGFLLGAVDYIVKPVNPVIVKARVQTHIALRMTQRELQRHRDELEEIILERTRELRETQIEITNRLVQAAEYHDHQTSRHITRMAHYCVILGRAHGMPEHELTLLFHASAMHDIGKLGISDAILHKKGTLTPDEFDEMKRHTLIGADLLFGSDNELMNMAHLIALTHHEKWDGTGFPLGLQKEEIPFPGRIAALCDVFDALSSKRPYKDAWPLSEAKKVIIEQKGVHFDPYVVELFLDNYEKVEEVYNKVK